MRSGVYKVSNRALARVLNNELTDLYKILTLSDQEIAKFFTPEILACALQHHSP